MFIYFLPKLKTIHVRMKIGWNGISATRLCRYENNAKNNKIMVIAMFSFLISSKISFLSKCKYPSPCFKLTE